MQSSGLPPLSNLPQWPHVGKLSPTMEPWSKEPHHFATDIERNLTFLQQQHAETLKKLHEEIDQLKRENKELHYKLIMHPALQKADSSFSTMSSKSILRTMRSGTSSSVSKAASSLKGSTAEGAIAEEQEESEKPVEKQSASSELSEVARVMQKGSELGGLEQESLAEQEFPSRTQVCDRMTSPITFPSPSQPQDGDVKIPAASSNPFLVNVLPSCVRKPPTLEECEVVIRQLWNINHMQMQELMYLRTCLDDIHKTKRIPEDYMLAGQLGNSDRPRLPRVKNTPKKLILTPLPAAERAVLPALKQTLGNAFAERQKRTQAIQRNRLHRTAL